MSLSHPPKAGDYSSPAPSDVIVRGLNLREPLHAVGVNLGNPVLEGCALHVVLDFAIPKGAF